MPTNPWVRPALQLSGSCCLLPLALQPLGEQDGELHRAPVTEHGSEIHTAWDNTAPVSVSLLLPLGGSPMQTLPPVLPLGGPTVLTPEEGQDPCADPTPLYSHWEGDGSPMQNPRGQEIETQVQGGVCWELLAALFPVTQSNSSDQRSQHGPTAELPLDTPWQNGTKHSGSHMGGGSPGLNTGLGVKSCNLVPALPLPSTFVLVSPAWRSLPCGWSVAIFW